MFWVLTIIVYRLFRGEREQTQYIEIVCDHFGDSDIVIPPPPQYLCEKAEAELKKATTDEV
jgi:hypothetical protein